jgi:hypothetical protein
VVVGTPALGTPCWAHRAISNGAEPLLAVKQGNGSAQGMA